MAEMSEQKLKELQRAYMEMQAIDQQLKMAGQQIAALDQQVEEINTISGSVGDMGGVSSGTELFVPLANGIFAKAKLADSKELLVNVGAGIVVPKSVADVRSLLSEQVERVLAARKDVNEKMEELAKHSKKLQARLGKLIED